MRDPSPAILRHLERTGDLAPDERALVGVKVSLPGSFGAAISTAARASDAVYSAPPDATMSQSAADAQAVGVSGRGPHFALALTSRRVLLYRRNLFGRCKERVWEAPIAQVDDVQISTGGLIRIALTEGGVLSLESPRLSLKHLPPVYRELPDTFQAARRAYCNR